MKIENGKIHVLDNLAKPANARPKDTASGNRDEQSITDTVDISNRKGEIQRLTERAKAEPAVRQDRVNELRAALEAKTYNVRGELVAKSLLKSQIFDELL